MHMSSLVRGDSQSWAFAIDYNIKASAGVPPAPESTTLGGSLDLVSYIGLIIGVIMDGR